ncbi:uncharacterized protein B0T23DRAFT_196921 [Neurospora hispaniola]|uniref:Uncharacterized protein n=1 Tax=Neurospora hispaniola TaxID=588809 RepID=A0AAJ0I488_9PEZI|nr:hypothetical protein B0T23DRAFT_196921 [Neurospora hispaniola]
MIACLCLVCLLSFMIGLHGLVQFGRDIITGPFLLLFFFRRFFPVLVVLVPSPQAEFLPESVQRAQAVDLSKRKKTGNRKQDNTG